MLEKNRVLFHLDVKFPASDLQKDPERYVGKNKIVEKTLLVNGYADENGYLTKSGRVYFASDESIAMDEARPKSDFFLSCYDNHDYTCARHEYHEHLMSLSRRISIYFDFNRDDFSGDPIRYQGNIPIDPLLIEANLMTSDGFLTSKGASMLNS